MKKSIIAATVLIALFYNGTKYNTYEQCLIDNVTSAKTELGARVMLNMCRDRCPQSHA